jgi:hypothetical protein
VIQTRCCLRDAGLVVLEQPDMASAMATCLSSFEVGVTDRPLVLVDGKVAYGVFKISPNKVVLRRAEQRQVQRVT